MWIFIVIELNKYINVLQYEQKLIFSIVNHISWAIKNCIIVKTIISLPVSARTISVFCDPTSMPIFFFVFISSLNDVMIMIIIFFLMMILMWNTVYNSQ